MLAAGLSGVVLDGAVAEWDAFVCGAVFALYTASGGSLWGPFFVAAFSGAVSLWFVGSRWRAREIAVHDPGV